MVAEPIEIHVDPDSETGKLLAQAGERPLRLVSGDREYRVEVVVYEEGDPTVADAVEREDPSVDHDNERSAAAWRASFGVWRGIDLEAFKAELREQRGQDSIGRPGE